MGEYFCEFRELQAIRESIIHECLVFVDKDRAIALIRENIIRKMLYLAHSRKFPLFGTQCTCMRKLMPYLPSNCEAKQTSPFHSAHM